MKQKLTATLGCLALSCALYGQNGWLSPVTFPANSNACDATAWKLVFYDEFNGTALSDKWTTTVRYDQAWVCRWGWDVQRSEHEYHAEARRSAGPSIFKDQNIIVSNGTCKMLQMYDPNSSWTVRDSTKCHYPDTTQYADLSTAIIRLPQEGEDGVRKGYSSGRFQARMKQPNFDGAWPAFWMWPGRGGVNEIDITEAWSGSGLHPVHFNAVAWKPDPNTYGFVDDAHMNCDYPYQTWFNYLFRSFPGVKYLNKEDWHTYTYEWDTASISAQLDNETPAKVWKYYQTKTYYQGKNVNGTWYAYENPYTVTTGSGCHPGNGEWKIPFGYPWNNDTSNCDVRISSGYTDGARSKYRKLYGNKPHLLGTLEVDFVKIWQRHPEKDNHTELCADNTYPAAPFITGPNQVCPMGAYSVSATVPGGQWSASSQFSLSNITAGTTSLSKQAGPAFNGGWISYKYGNGIEGCPLKGVTKNNLYCNQGTDWVIVVPFVSNNNGEGRFHFISELYYKRDVSGGSTPVVTWNIKLNSGSDTYDARTAESHILQGQYASSPSFILQPNEPYYLKWTIYVTDASGTWSRSGERNSKTALLQQAKDPNAYYLNAYINEQGKYDNTVSYNIASNMVSEEEYSDTLFMSEMIEKTKAEALAPYLITDELGLFKKTASEFSSPGNDDNTSTAAENKSAVFPNPVNSTITILAGTSFKDGAAIQLIINDLLGRCVYSNVLHYQKGNTMKADLSNLQHGQYVLKLKQGSKEEYIKITKNEL